MPGVVRLGKLTSGMDTTTADSAGSARDGERPPERTADRPAPAFPDAPWLLRHRVTVPERVPELLQRPALTGRAALTDRRVTLLLAPGGFGKTTLLAECCRLAAAAGVRTAWLSLDDEEPGALDAYLAFAFQQAGIDVGAGLRGRRRDADIPHPRTTLVLQALDAGHVPCILALDELERVRNPAAVAVLDFLVRAAPPNLHLAIACRELPGGLDIAVPVSEDDGALITATDLRFTHREIAALCPDQPTRARVDAIAAASDGWPVAVRFHCNAERYDAASVRASAMRHLTGEWVGARLWPTLDEGDRRLLLAIGQFDWFDEALLVDALEEPDAMARVTGMQQIDGLLCPTGVGDDRVVSLHPLLREHCARALRREDPVRYAAVHRRIAGALAHRNATVDAMRHATEAGDATLAGKMLLDAGGLRLALREGFDRLGAAARLVPWDVAKREPRLTLAACVADAASGRLAQARRALARVARVSPAGLSGEALELSADRWLARVIVANYGCESALTEMDLPPDVRRLADDPAIEPLVRATMEYAYCVGFTMHGAFERGRAHGERVLRDVGGAPFLTASVHLHAGQAAMAQGRVADAVAHYRRGGEIAERSFLQEPLLALAATTFSQELDLERNRLAVAGPARLPHDAYSGFGLDACIATTDLAVEHARMAGGPGAAIKTLDSAIGDVPEGELPGLRRHLAASRVGLLAEAGNVAAARDTWAAAELPRRGEDCADLLSRSWREAESVSCARVRLLAAEGDGDGARRLAGALMAAFAKRGLRRPVMRLQALCVAVAFVAGQRKTARADLAEYLDLYVETDYAHCLLREHGAADVLADFVDVEAPGPGRDAASRLLALANPDGSAPRLTARELDILARLEHQRDDAIAAALGLSRAGVRYHVKKLFTKLDVHRRRDAARRARELGLLPSEAVPPK